MTAPHPLISPAPGSPGPVPARGDPGDNGEDRGGGGGGGVATSLCAGNIAPGLSPAAPGEVGGREAGVILPGWVNAAPSGFPALGTRTRRYFFAFFFFFNPLGNKAGWEPGWRLSLCCGF